MYLSRLRHRRGFGIHSPFAYAMVKEVIVPKRGYTYYSEPIDRCDATGLTRRWHRIAMLAFRWCARHRTRRLAATASVPAAAVNHVALADSRMLASHDSMDKAGMDTLLIASSADLSPQLMGQLLVNADAPVVIGVDYDEAMVRAAAAARSTGILFSSPRLFMLVPYGRTAFVEIDIRF